jgi:CDGSH-type Zn-finger protein
MPAPATPYPNTIDCKYCQPRGEHRRGLPEQQPDGTWRAVCRCGAVATGSTLAGARNKLVRLHDPALLATRLPGVDHRINAIEQPDGSFLAKCRCGESATAPSRIAARRRVDRLHRKLVEQAMLDGTFDALTNLGQELATGELKDT